VQEPFLQALEDLRYVRADGKDAAMSQSLACTGIACRGRFEQLATFAVLTASYDDVALVRFLDRLG